jgi:hypothetical protein
MYVNRPEFTQPATRAGANNGTSQEVLGYASTRDSTL